MMMLDGLINQSTELGGTRNPELVPETRNFQPSSLSFAVYKGSGHPEAFHSHGVIPKLDGVTRGNSDHFPKMITFSG